MSKPVRYARMDSARGGLPKKAHLSNLLRDVLLAGWYGIRFAGRSHRGSLPAADARLHRIAGRLRRNVTHLSETIGERNLSRRPQALARCADWIASELAAHGARVQRQTYRVSGIPCDNLETEIPGAGRPEEIVVVGAHYDTVPGSPGANDNASGVAAMLELASRFADKSPTRTLRFVAFANEEAPYAYTDAMGSWVYARRCRQRGETVCAMLCLETMGCYSDAPGSQTYPKLIALCYPSKGDFIAFVGNTRYGGLVRQAVAAFRRAETFPSEAGALPEVISDISRSDHWSFWQEGYPALMITDTADFRSRVYHTGNDTVDKIDFDRLARVVRGLEAVVSDLADRTSA